jgi:hypothetical protein
MIRSNIREQAAIDGRFMAGRMEERKMPVLLLWAVPAVIFVGGVGYMLVRTVH